MRSLCTAHHLVRCASLRCSANPFTSRREIITTPHSQIHSPLPQHQKATPLIPTCHTRLLSRKVAKMHVGAKTTALSWAAYPDKPPTTRLRFADSPLMPIHHRCNRLSMSWGSISPASQLPWDTAAQDPAMHGRGPVSPPPFHPRHR
jgi:hypothetical protein